jgi:transcriptional regulator GlxA family with amidase domain
MTPFEYMLAGRMNRARHLLTSTNLSVQEVAVRAGYENPLYFSRLFAARIGLTPTAYRALHQGAGLEGGRPSRRTRADSRRPS